MSAAARYELLMMLRKRSLWLTMAIVTVLVGLLGYQDLREPAHDSRTAVVTAAVLLNLFLPAAYGSLLADRLIRDTRLGVGPILDATPAAPMARLVGKYLGVCAAVAAPIAMVYLGFAVVYAIASGRYVAVGWALATFATVLVPAVLFAGALALAVPLAMPAPLFRVLFVVYWFWGNGIHPLSMPTLSQTLVSPLGDYPLQVFFGFRGDDGTPAGPEPGASLNFLRPEVSATTAWLSIAVLLAIAALVLYAADAARARSTR
jgi:ABC-2 type transport system permease protein